MRSRPPVQPGDILRSALRLARLFAVKLEERNEATGDNAGHKNNGRTAGDWAATDAFTAAGADGMKARKTRSALRFLSEGKKSFAPFSGSTRLAIR